MPILLARIDDRLIHGQVVEGWLKIIGADCIIVVSDHVANNSMQQALLKMAVPKGIEVVVSHVGAIKEKLLDKRFEKKKIILLFSSPKDVAGAIENGVDIKSVNVGGMHYSAGKRQILPTLSIDMDDARILKEMAEKGIELEGRVLPKDERINVIDVMKREIGE